MWKRPIKLYQIKTKINQNFTDNALQIKKVLKLNLGVAENVANRILHKHPTLTRADPEQMIGSIQELRSMNLSRTEVASYPLILHRNHFILRDNRRLLAEVGLMEVTAYRLFNFAEITNGSVQFNEQYHFLPRNINILQHIFDVAKVDIEIGNAGYKKTDSLIKIHANALVHYMRQHLHCSSDQIAEILQRNAVSFGRSIQGIEESLMIVKRTTKQTILNETVRTYCLTLFPEQMKTIFSLESIYGIDLQEILSARNSLSHFPIDRCLKSADVLLKYKIPEHIVRKNKKLLFRRPDELEEDLKLISSIVTDRKYFEHVYFGSLLNNIRRLKTNMEKHKMDFYKTVDEKFIDFFLNGYLFKHYSQILPYFSFLFNVTEIEARKAISSHPQWNKIGLPIIHRNIEFLLSHGFTHEDIFRDINVVLYSFAEIKDILRKLNDPSEANQLGLSTELTNSQKLRLIVYFIEQKCGFNGEGVYLLSDQTEYDDNESVRLEAIINACLRNGSNINLHDYIDEDDQVEE